MNSRKEFHGSAGMNQLQDEIRFELGRIAIRGKGMIVLTPKPS